MAKVDPMDLLKGLHGKICEHSDTYFAKKGKTNFTGKICNPRTKPFTTAELARQQMFATARANMAALSEPTKAGYVEAYKNVGHKKYATLNGYIFAQEYDKLANPPAGI